MKKSLLFLPVLLLAACAPAVQEPDTVYTATVQATCAAALAEVAHRAPSVKPVTPGVGGVVWTYYRVTSARDEKVELEADNALDSSRLYSTWTCTPADNGQVVLRSASRGQPRSDAGYSFNVLFKALNLIR